MKQDSRWQLGPMVLVWASSVTVTVTGVLQREALGLWQWGIYAAALLAVIGTLGFRRRLSSAEQEFAAAQTNLAEREVAFKEDLDESQRLQSEWESDVADQAKRLDKREKDLADRLVAFREWMEFPQPLDLSQPQPTDAELEQLAEMDRRMFELLNEQTRVLFDNVRQNKYVEDGRLQAQLIRDDLYELAISVARIYRGDAVDPMLETSLAQILTALSRACMHFQVVLEELPIKVKDYSLKSLYSYIRTAVKAYGVYKSAEPFLSFANHAFYLTRLALGGSPVTLGAYWMLSMAGKESTKAITKRVVNRQALALLHNVVRVIGCEVAGIYGGDFRHRDPNWIYAIELVEVTRRLPNTREWLTAAMQEIGVLQLRNEYDRIYLYRCLATSHEVDPDPYRADVVLNNEERQAVASRLERFLATHFADLSAHPAVEEWREQLEQRLHLQVELATAPRPAGSPATQVEEAVRSLASFLLGIKQLEVEDIPEHLKLCHLYSSLAGERQERLLAEIRENPPYFFEQPDVDARSVVADQYLEDLAELEVMAAPRDEQVEAAMDNVATYLRRERGEMQQILKRRFQNRLIDLIPDLPAPRELDTAVSRAVMDILDHAGQPLFLYDRAEVHQQDDVLLQNLWLLGTQDEMYLLQTEPQLEVIWRGDTQNANCQCSRQYFQRSCRVLGGLWLNDFDSQANIVLLGGWFSSLEASFQALLDLMNSEG